MKEKEIEQLMEAAAAEARVRLMAQRDCADLPEWGRRRDRRDTLLRYAVAASLALTMTIPTALSAQECDHITDPSLSYSSALSSVRDSLLL